MHRSICCAAPQAIRGSPAAPLSQLLSALQPALRAIGGLGAWQVSIATTGTPAASARVVHPGYYTLQPRAQARTRLFLLRRHLHFACICSDGIPPLRLMLYKTLRHSSEG